MFSKDKKFIGKLFDEISPTYDKLNHLLSLNQDKKWRRDAVIYLSKQNKTYNNILDLASGTGDLGKEFLRLNPDKIFSVDLSFEMLKINKSKINPDFNFPIQAEAEKLPFKDSYFDAAGSAFGIRSFQSIENCINEINRVLSSGGKLVVIEFFKYNSRRIRRKILDNNVKKLIAKIGNSISKNEYAYDYLFESIDNFLTLKEFIELLDLSGFKTELIKRHFFGYVNTVIASKS